MESDLNNLGRRQQFGQGGYQIRSICHDSTLKVRGSLGYVQHVQRPTRGVQEGGAHKYRKAIHISDEWFVSKEMHCLSRWRQWRPVRDGLQKGSRSNETLLREECNQHQVYCHHRPEETQYSFLRTRRQRSVSLIVLIMSILILPPKKWQRPTRNRRRPLYHQRRQQTGEIISVE